MGCLRCIAAIVLSSSIIAIQALADQAEVKIRSLPVPISTIYAGDLITSDLLTSRQFQTTSRSISGIALDSSEVVGKQSRRRLVAGRPIPLTSLTVPLLVRKGQLANAVYQEDGFLISTPVTALRDGSAGDIIDARATATGAVIQVQILKDGSLSVVSQ